MREESSIEYDTRKGETKDEKQKRKEFTDDVVHDYGVDCICCNRSRGYYQHQTIFKHGIEEL